MSLSNFKVLSFDVYGTMIDWEVGAMTALQPLLSQLPNQPPRKEIIDTLHDLEKDQQAKTPNLLYRELLTAIYPRLAAHLQLPAPSHEESAAFGASVGKWPAFPDSVEALKRLSKHYKLVVLSNTDHKSFAATNAGPLQGVKFDLVITAQDVGSYKPDLTNFKYMVKAVKEKFDVDMSEILQTAQSQFHDHHPARKMGIKSAWIARRGAIMGNRSEEIYDWKFDTLGQMADAVDNP